VCKILAEQEIKPHKVRYYPEQRDSEFEPKMAEILCVYRQVAILRGHAATPDRPPLPATSPTVMRDHEYKATAL
jgi:hypothetical protein